MIQLFKEILAFISELQAFNHECENSVAGDVLETEKRLLSALKLSVQTNPKEAQTIFKKHFFNISLTHYLKYASNIKME